MTDRQADEQLDRQACCRRSLDRQGLTPKKYVVEVLEEMLLLLENLAWYEYYTLHLKILEVFCPQINSFLPT